MAYVMIAEGLHDAEFLRTHCVGFDASQMPPGAEGEESYSDYILGARDGIPKTPRWAEAITAVPARNHRAQRPGVCDRQTRPCCTRGWGVQRRAYGGKRPSWRSCVLAAMTGNVGVPGGWAGGKADQAPDGGALWTVFPVGENPIKATIPVFLWTEAILRGKEDDRQVGRHPGRRPAG